MLVEAGQAGSQLSRPPRLWRAGDGAVVLCLRHKLDHWAPTTSTCNFSPWQGEPEQCNINSDGIPGLWQCDHCQQNEITLVQRAETRQGPRWGMLKARGWGWTKLIAAKARASPRCPPKVRGAAVSWEENSCSWPNKGKREPEPQWNSRSKSSVDLCPKCYSRVNPWTLPGGVAQQSSGYSSPTLLHSLWEGANGRWSQWWGCLGTPQLGALQVDVLSRCPLSRADLCVCLRSNPDQRVPFQCLVYPHNCWEQNCHGPN